MNQTNDGLLIECPEGISEEYLEAYSLGNLDEKEMDDLEKHLNECQACDSRQKLISSMIELFESESFQEKLEIKLSTSSSHQINSKANHDDNKYLHIKKNKKK